MWHNLDVHRALKPFLIRTESIHKLVALFINISQPKLGQKMSKAAISEALKVCIVEAYKALKNDVPEGITAHSRCQSGASHSPYLSPGIDNGLHGAPGTQGDASSPINQVLADRLQMNINYMLHLFCEV